MSAFLQLFAPSGQHKRDGTGDREYFKHSLKSTLFSVFIEQLSSFPNIFLFTLTVTGFLYEKEFITIKFLSIFFEIVSKNLSHFSIPFSLKIHFTFFSHLPLVLELCQAQRFLNQNTGCTQHHFLNLDQMDSVKYFEARQKHLQ